MANTPANNNVTTAKAPTAQQPMGATQMMTTAAPTTDSRQEHKPMRLRGGGAGKDCFLGAVECFLCFECCKDCCECWADIICCPCEMCC